MQQSKSERDLVLEELRSRSFEYLLKEKRRLIRSVEDGRVSLALIDEELRRRQGPSDAASARKFDSVSMQDVRLNESGKFYSNEMELTMKMRTFSTVKGDNCPKCGNPWFFDMHEKWECTMCFNQQDQPAFVEL